MAVYLENLPFYTAAVRSMADILITNIVLIGQVPAPTFQEDARSALFLQRLAEFQVDECTMDAFGNPIGIIRGTSSAKPPIFAVARMDSPFSADVDHHFTVRENAIYGAGLMDNSLGVAALASLPMVLNKLDLSFESDIVLAGVVQSNGRGNLGGIRQLLKNWDAPIRGAVCIESGELGRLNYYSDGASRCEIICHVDTENERPPRFKSNAILVLNEVVNQIQELRLPLRPRTKIIFGMFNAGLKHGEIAADGVLGLEIRSDSDDMVKNIYNDISDILSGIGHQYEVDLKLSTISNVRAARLKYNHPLVKSTMEVMERLGIAAWSESSESELSIFLSRRIPAVTLGISHGESYQAVDAGMRIDPMFKGIVQVVGTLLSIDQGSCDDYPLA